MTKKFLIFIGAMPPPIHGQSIINEKLLVHFKNNTDIHPILSDISPRIQSKSFIYHATRCIKVIKTLLIMLSMRIYYRQECRVVYISSDGGFGLIYTACMVGLARLLNYKIYTHYHSFAFIDKPTYLMKLLIRFGGKNLTHIFLCDIMRSRYQKVYGQGKSLLLRNTVFLNTNPHIIDNHKTNIQKPLIIGLMSNLSSKKGLLDFLDILKQAHTKKLYIKGILAGPVASQKYHHDIYHAKTILGDMLEYRGAVYGNDKHKFFNDIDIFIFPTRYTTEAQPNVLFEAMSYGLPIISFDRGGIASQISNSVIDGSILEKLDQSWALSVPQTENFSEIALFWIQKFIDNPDIIHDYNNASLCAYKTHLNLSQQELASFCKNIKDA